MLSAGIEVATRNASRNGDFPPFALNPFGSLGATAWTEGGRSCDRFC
jgi:hypothetical protein